MNGLFVITIISLLLSHVSVFGCYVHDGPVLYIKSITYRIAEIFVGAYFRIISNFPLEVLILNFPSPSSHTPWETCWANLNFLTCNACFLCHQGNATRLPYLQGHLERRNRRKVVVRERIG